LADDASAGIMVVVDVRYTTPGLWLV